MAGETELTRIPEGARKSAAALVIPSTQAVRLVSVWSNHTTTPKLTLRRTVGQATGGGVEPDDGREVDDAATLLDDTLVE